jgi:hypothetical protein
MVVTPKLFVRCGYPLYPGKIMFERKGEVNALMFAAWYAMNKHTFGRTVPKLDLDDLPPWIKPRLRNMALTVILHREKFGGRERKIYEEENNNLQDKIFTLEGKRFVRTGTYTPGWSNHSDWQLPSLDNAKMHCVYKLNIDLHWLGNNWSNTIEILAEHCSKDKADDFLTDEVLKKIDASI